MFTAKLMGFVWAFIILPIILVAGTAIICKLAGIDLRSL